MNPAVLSPLQSVKPAVLRRGEGRGSKEEDSAVEQQQSSVPPQPGPIQAMRSIRSLDLEKCQIKTLKSLKDSGSEATKMPGTDAFFTEGISAASERGKVMLKPAT